MGHMQLIIYLILYIYTHIHFILILSPSYSLRFPWQNPSPKLLNSFRQELVAPFPLGGRESMECACFWAMSWQPFLRFCNIHGQLEGTIPFGLATGDAFCPWDHLVRWGHKPGQGVAIWLFFLLPSLLTDSTEVFLLIRYPNFLSLNQTSLELILTFSVNNKTVRTIAVLGQMALGLFRVVSLWVWGRS